MYGILENTQNMLSQEDDSQPSQIQRLTDTTQYIATLYHRNRASS